MFAERQGHMEGFWKCIQTDSLPNPSLVNFERAGGATELLGQEGHTTQPWWGDPATDKQCERVLCRGTSAYVTPRLVLPDPRPVALPALAPPLS